MASGNNVRPHVRNFKIGIFTDNPDLQHVSDYYSLLSHPRFKPSLPHDSSELSELIGDYRAPDEIRCAFGHPHKIGFVAELVDGTVTLIGNRCADSHFNVEAYRLLAKQLANRQAQEQLRQTLQGLDDLRDKLAAHSNSDDPLSTGSLFRAMKKLSRALPEQAQEQLSHMRRNRTGRIIVVRSEDGPELDFLSRKDREERGYDLWEEEVGNLRGAACLTSLLDAHAIIRETRLHIARLKQVVEADSQRARRDVNVTLSDITKNLNRLEEARRQLVRFLDLKNLEQLCLVVSGERPKKDLRRAIRRYSISGVKAAA